MPTDDPSSFTTGDTPPVVVVGQTGQRGAVGRPGQTGPVGPSSVLSAAQVIALFVFVVGVFLILLWRINIQTQDLREVAYQQCELTQQNAASLDRLLDQAIVAARSRSDLTPEVRKDYIANYTAAKPISSDCGETP